jgi:hypothetical protein
VVTEPGIFVRSQTTETTRPDGARTVQTRKELDLVLIAQSKTRTTTTTPDNRTVADTTTHGALVGVPNIATIGATVTVGTTVGAGVSVGAGPGSILVNGKADASVQTNMRGDIKGGAVSVDGSLLGGAAAGASGSASSTVDPVTGARSNEAAASVGVATGTAGVKVRTGGLNDTNGENHGGYGEVEGKFSVGPAQASARAGQRTDDTGTTHVVGVDAQVDPSKVVGPIGSSLTVGVGAGVVSQGDGASETESNANVGPSRYGKKTDVARALPPPRIRQIPASPPQPVPPRQPAPPTAVAPPIR